MGAVVFLNSICADFFVPLNLFVTTGTPPDVVAKLQTELAKIIKLPDVQAKLKGLGGEPGNLSVDQFTQLNRQDFERFGKLIRQANIKMQ